MATERLEFRLLGTMEVRHSMNDLFETISAETQRIRAEQPG